MEHPATGTGRRPALTLVTAVPPTCRYSLVSDQRLDPERGAPIIQFGPLFAMTRHSVVVSVQTIAGDGVLLRRTTSADFSFLLSFFSNPAVYDIWDGHPMAAADIRVKYLGGRSPEVECFIVQHEERDVEFVQYHQAHDGAGGGMDL